MPRVRVHQHVNPLAPFYRQAPQPVDPATAFTDPELPIHLDIGCARGRFILGMAEAEPKWNFLGVEIREPLVEEANRITVEKGLPNVHYVFCNAMLWLDRLLEKIPQPAIQMVTIQFPDPWFKKKHAKRRMVNRQLVEMVVGKLAAGGKIFVQTDIELLADEITDLFCANPDLKQNALSENPFAVKTERELAVERKGGDVYRRLFEKK